MVSLLSYGYSWEVATHSRSKTVIKQRKCPGITKGRLKVWLSFQKGSARDGSAWSDGTKAVLLQRYARLALLQL